MFDLHFSPSEDFELRSESGKIFFVHKKSQARVSTDNLGRIIWENLPGPKEEVIQRSEEKAGAEEGLAQDFLHVMHRAGLIKSSSAEEEILPSERAGEKAAGLVSAIVVTYNSEEHIKACVESVLSQTYKNLEVIIVDNASKDQTVRIVQTHYPRVRVFPLRKNFYFPGGVNYGLKRAKGEYFLILNDDLELDDHCVSSLVEKMISEKQAGAIVPMMKFYHLRGFVNGIGNQIRDQGWGSDNFIGCVDVGQFHSLNEVPSACFGAVLLRRKACDDVGLLDHKYQSYYEDSDWSFRCWMQGWKIIPEVRALTYHKFGAHWKTSGLKLKLVARNRLRLILKLFQGRTLFRFLRRYVTEDARNFLSLLKREEFGSAAAYIKAYFSLALGLPDIYLQRRKIFKKKRAPVRASDILRKNPTPFSCLNEDNIPVLDSCIITSYYKQHLEK